MLATARTVALLAAVHSGRSWGLSCPALPRRLQGSDKSLSEPRRRRTELPAQNRSGDSRAAFHLERHKGKEQKRLMSFMGWILLGQKQVLCPGSRAQWEEGSEPPGQAPGPSSPVAPTSRRGASQRQAVVAPWADFP